MEYKFHSMKFTANIEMDRGSVLSPATELCSRDSLVETLHKEPINAQAS